MDRNRLAAVVAAVTVGGGAATMLVALVAAPGAWWSGYVSEAGTAGQPYAVAYRWGLLALGVGVAVLGAALRSRLRLAGGCLVVAAVLAGTSAAVPCSHQCPLPPYEPTTPADVVHTAASILGMVLLAAAMLAVVLTARRPADRRLAAAALAVHVPLGGTLGLTMLLAGRGTTGAVLERLLLVVAVSWLVGAALLTASAPGRSVVAAGRHPASQR